MGEEARLTTSFPLLAAMAFITYVLLAGMALGIQKRLVLTLLFSLLAYLPSSLGNGCRGLCQAPAHSVPPLASHLTPAPGWLLLTPFCHGCRFSPEVLGLCASTALVWVFMEVLALLLGLYLATVRSELSTFHLLAYSGYKYVG